MKYICYECNSEDYEDKLKDFAICYECDTDLEPDRLEEHNKKQELIEDLSGIGKREKYYMIHCEIEGLDDTIKVLTDDIEDIIIRLNKSIDVDVLDYFEL